MRRRLDARDGVGRSSYFKEVGDELTSMNGFKYCGSPLFDSLVAVINFNIHWVAASGFEE
jgi:hypothetical protein